MLDTIFTVAYPSPANNGKYCDSKRPIIKKAEKDRTFLIFIVYRCFKGNCQGKLCGQMTIAWYIRNWLQQNLFRKIPVFLLRCSLYFLIQFKHGKECLLRHFHITDLLHTFFSFFLLLKQLTFTADITSVTFCRNVFTHRFDRFTSYNLSTDSGLNSYFKLLSRNEFFQLLTHPTPQIVIII